MLISKRLYINAKAGFAMPQALHVKASFFFTFFTRKQSVYKEMLSYKAQNASLASIKYIFEQVMYVS